MTYSDDIVGWSAVQGLTSLGASGYYTENDNYWPSSTVYVTASYLNVRTGPGTSYTIIKQEPHGAFGTIEFGRMTDNNGYVWVPVYFSDGTVGWCTILYLQPENFSYKISPTQGYYYTVQSGDTLWDIAYLAYGNGSYYWYIMDANGLTNTTIYPGEVLYIPIL